MLKNVDVSIIIVNWNGKHWLKDCLSSIYLQDYKNFEVILVDNGSTDGSVEYVKENFPETITIKLNRNYGFAKANNIGIRCARGEYLILISNDTKVCEGWLRELISYAKDKKYENFQLLVSIQLPSQHPDKIRDISLFGDIKIYEVKTSKPIIRSLFASGACFLIKRNWLNKLNYLFDESYGLLSFGEDLDLSLRTFFMGGDIGYVKSSKVYHYGGGSWKNLGIQKIKFKALKNSMRNVTISFFKALTLKSFIKIYILKIIYILARFLAKPTDVSKNLSMLIGLAEATIKLPLYRKIRKSFKKIKIRSDLDFFLQFKFNPCRRIERVIWKFLQA